MQATLQPMQKFRSEALEGLEGQHNATEMLSEKAEMSFHRYTKGLRVIQQAQTWQRNPLNVRLGKNERTKAQSERNDLNILKRIDTRFEI